MQSPSKITGPSEKVIDDISNTLVMAVAEANRGNLGLRCTSLGDPDLSDPIQLAEHIRAFQLAQIVIKRGLDRRIASAKRHWNALQSVNKLPVEVLSTVFHQLLATVSTFDHFTSLFNIAKVSVRWKSIIDATPSLWSFVSSTFPRAQVDRALKKSARSPVSVACRFPGYLLTATSKEGSRNFLTKMQSTGRPWDELTLHLPSIGHLRTVLEAPASHLRKLEIKVQHASSKPVDIFGGTRRVLEDLSLTGAWIKCDPNALTGLRRLQLDYNKGFAGPTLTQIFWLLQQSPILHFFAWSGRVIHHSMSLPTGTITLSHLTGLSLKGVPGSDVSVILGLIHAPSCRHFTLHCNSDSKDGYSRLLVPLQRFLPSLKNSLQQVATISVCLGLSSFHYHCIPPSCDSSYQLDFKFEGEPPYSLLEWFAQHLHDINLKTPPINIRFDPRFDFTRDTTLPALFRLRNVVSLKLADRVVGPCRLLQGLSRPTRSQGGSEFWPFPELADMKIAPSNLLIRNVLDFFRSRYIEQLGQGCPRRPPMLKTLHLVGYEWDGFREEQELKPILRGTKYSLERSVWVDEPRD
ncbi:hypothetical protein FS837_012711 [Tulasnella sp. UAMH 9824]|nr:hypothetical protein FS837_012711 [Tulasnella sp. UAMH 9824]